MANINNQIEKNKAALAVITAGGRVGGELGDCLILIFVVIANKSYKKCKSSWRKFTKSLFLFD